MGQSNEGGGRARTETQAGRVGGSAPNSHFPWFCFLIFIYLFVIFETGSGSPDLPASAPEC